MPHSDTSEVSLSPHMSDKKRKRDSVRDSVRGLVDSPLDDNGTATTNKKRKVVFEDVIEVDVNAPEPPSKKALRKAKKQKARPSSGDTDQEAEGAAKDAKTSQDAFDEHTKGRETVAFGIWIGNLPFTITKQMLSTFLTSNAKDGLIPATAITRINLPAPRETRPPSSSGDKPVNRGFAYVDFANKPAMEAALALSETSFGGRNVLIKDAKSFEGRPAKSSSQETGLEKTASGVETARRKPTRRVFVGNLGFDVTREDLSEHFAQCGYVDNVHMATFEDTGKCKGFAWVTFTTGDAAEAAARGWIMKQDDFSPDSESGPKTARTAEVDESNDANSRPPSMPQGKKAKGRKWFVNRLMGRPLRCELAEDATTRYQKRFGKSGKDLQKNPVGSWKHDASESKGEGDETLSDRTQRGSKTKRHKQHSSAAYGGDGDSRYRTGAIAVPEGRKITFDD